MTIRDLKDSSCHSNMEVGDQEVAKTINALPNSHHWNPTLA